MNPQFDHDDDIEPLSKTQLKRESEELQALGEKLIPLDRKQLETLQLPDKLFDALLEAKRLKAHGAIARHKQFIGKLMRNVDPAPIQALLDKLAGVSDTHNAWLHGLERQRDRLLSDPKALEVLIDEQPQLDVQQVRQLIRNAQKEKASLGSPKPLPMKAYRELFQLLKSCHPEPALPGTLPATSDDGHDD
ncbi:ribosome biogenesis factor YjgA [Chitinilyticum litopenaei]|uniref:ribosome biogenesis factor YjgA n=1 Tax=Chitinilyticum litopenaei TaxID=1121276 RepID=UPI000427589E|nr:ribosome biogenesis factor YjgA [Chitinilyticum litopenaei]